MQAACRWLCERLLPPKLSPDQVDKIMKRSCAIALLVLFTLGASAQKADTLVVGSHDLEMQNLQLGNSAYVVYFHLKLI